MTEIIILSLHFVSKFLSHAEKAMRTFAGPAALPFIGGFYGDIVVDTVLY